MLWHLLLLQRQVFIKSCDMIKKSQPGDCQCLAPFPSTGTLSYCVSKRIFIICASSFFSHCAIKPGMELNDSYVGTKYFSYHTCTAKTNTSNYRKNGIAPFITFTDNNTIDTIFLTRTFVQKEKHFSKKPRPISSAATGSGFLRPECTE